MSTLAASIHRPEPAEYDPYYERYISLVKTDDMLATLQKQAQQTRDLLGKLTAEQSEFRYAPGKWSVKEVLGHVNDTERIMSYRVLRIARGDQTPIEGFEQDDYVTRREIWSSHDRRSASGVHNHPQRDHPADSPPRSRNSGTPRHRQQQANQRPRHSLHNRRATNCTTEEFSRRNI